MSMSLAALTPDEVAEHDEYLRQASIADAWHRWALASCEERGGHWWFLDVCPWGDTDLTCSGCGAFVDDIVPDGWDLVGGEFYVSPGYTLSLDGRDVLVNGRRAEENLLAYGWRGPVSVTVRVEKYGWECPEYDVWIDLAAA